MPKKAIADSFEGLLEITRAGEVTPADSLEEGTPAVETGAVLFTRPGGVDPGFSRTGGDFHTSPLFPTGRAGVGITGAVSSKAKAADRDNFVSENHASHSITRTF